MVATASESVVKGSGTGVPEELKDYFMNKFRSADNSLGVVSDNEPSIAFWKSHASDWAGDKAFPFLRTCYPQLNFPVVEGINKTQAYIDAVLKGKPPVVDADLSPALNQPEALRLTLHESLAGPVPVLIVPDADDFVRLVRCLIHKNNPVAVPPSMGALLANGVNNWERIRELKTQWESTHPLGGWNEQFSRHVLPNPGLFKDKLIILSTKPYSNVSAEQVGVDPSEWASYSLAIRLAHECTHLYTLNRFGSASNNLHDELVADYMGICNAVGHFRKEWMLAFLGLENYPAYRNGARLENYVGNTQLSTESFYQLTSLIKRAIDTIDRFDARVGEVLSAHDGACRMDALCLTDLAVLASVDGPERLFQTYTNRMMSLLYNQID